MWRFIANLYARRIVNVNVNILVAGSLALIPVLGIIKGYHALGLDKRLPDFVLQGVTFLADVICDVVFYYVLHFLANHFPWRRMPVAPVKGAAATMHVLADASVEHVPFFKDATKVQLQRAVLSPLLYGLWLGTQWYLIHIAGWDPVPATALGAAIGIGTARCLHTIWMLWEMRRNSRQPRPVTNTAAPQVAVAPPIEAPATAIAPPLAEHNGGRPQPQRRATGVGGG